MIEIKNLSKSFGKKEVLQNLSFNVKDGVAFGFLGRNGTGKTTTIRILMNIFREDSGEVLVNGTPAYEEKSRIGYLPEERGLYAKRKIREQLIYLGRLKGLDPASLENEVLSKLDEMEALEYADVKLETLSKGNQQKIQLVASLLGEPEVVVLDEPFSGLDPINAQILKKAIRRQVDLGKTVIFSSHQMAQVEEFCDDICIINHGKSVISGNLNEIKRAYPRDRIYVKGSLAGTEAPQETLASLPGVLSTEPFEDGWRIALTDAGAKDHLFDALGSAKFSIDTFSVMEPTLEQIFVEKAGDPPAGTEAVQ
ncbi:MAG: ATP-binding cassette domain-containing protein [Clostridiales Family XIII bacterium]|jgi:ABC-2 type transport system ATP-binding protein|nr:ATP-binding cassette domain-containing protein [Clostridiales Family XIII bacterium]